MNATLLNCLKSHELADPLAEDEAAVGGAERFEQPAGLPALNFVRAERRLLSGRKGRTSRSGLFIPIRTREPDFHSAFMDHRKDQY